MKPTKDFKLSKETKRILSGMTGDVRSFWKKMMIDAELAEKKAKMAKLKDRSNANQGEE